MSGKFVDPPEIRGNGCFPDLASPADDWTDADGITLRATDQISGGTGIVAKLLNPPADDAHTPSAPEALERQHVEYTHRGIVIVRIAIRCIELDAVVDGQLDVVLRKYLRIGNSGRKCPGVLTGIGETIGIVSARRCVDLQAQRSVVGWRETISGNDGCEEDIGELGTMIGTKKAVERRRIGILNRHTNG